ncbi:pre-peptidase C-terminal domain-containing protein [Hahella aquimaris]|uniref:pre-peptidase C-terminal domain-containing protein n=1 Tax=Hahella sp. HNIBRBA332 TaxID=3015983 RepID=UPI00273AA3A1|nr:pre-peptidase C-terminal domain-containing protein [Hahella sp. HNIBRBA332]WLQ12079.1 pre-peptidase C-terminal domain-containing protein [Hahella sp. HNIBRBA332]
MNKNTLKRAITFSVSTLALSVSAVTLAEVSGQDAQYVRDYLERFHADPAAVMDEVPVKEAVNGDLAMPLFSDEAILSGDFVEDKDELRRDLLNSTGGNGFMMMRSMELSNDNAARLVDNGDQLIGNVHAMDNSNLTNASLDIQPWSDDYWALYKGALGIRYADPKLNDSWPSNWYDHWIFATSTHKPQEYIDAGEIDNLSPSEKYDLLVGDSNFTLTQKMWESGKGYWDRYGSVEAWMGLCHGWAPAAYMLPRPSNSITVKSPEGKDIKFFPSDIKALGTLLWAEASPGVRFIGGRCNSKDPGKDENGRILDQACFDSNPGSWHKAVVNQIGVSKRSFVIDATFDYEVWNQPVLKYEYTYFNPQTGASYNTAQEAIIAMSDYTQDKFSKYRAQEAKQVVGVQMKLTYIVETSPTHRDKDYPSYDRAYTVRYVYDLELDSNGDIIGGEWYNNRHPDFLWTPAPGAHAVSYYNPTGSTSETKTEKKAGVIEQNKWAFYGPFTTTGSFKVTMTGDSDADLYVNKGAQPGDTTYQCRPYLEGSNEECSANEAGTYYVGVKGYNNSSNYSLNIQYTQGGSGWTKGQPIPSSWKSNAKNAAGYSQPLTTIVEQLFNWSAE